MRGFSSKRVRSERGAALVLVVAAMLGVVSAAALAIDIGHLVLARTEAQRAADAAALAGAASLISAPDNVTQARAWATDYAARNAVRGITPVLNAEDIDVILDSSKVRVRVHMDAAHGTPISTFFARAFGVRRVNIGALAAAEASPADAVGGGADGTCLLPLAIIDEWLDDGDGVWSSPPDTYDPDQGFSEADYGRQLLLKLAPEGEDGNAPPEWCEQPAVDVCNAQDASWYCWYREAHPSEGGGGGVDVLGPRIYPATDCGPELGVGDEVWAASGSGNKQSLVNGVDGPNSFKDLIEADPNVHWYDPDGAGGERGCVVRGASTDCLAAGESLRIRTVPIVDPSTIGPYSDAELNANIADFMGVFIESVSCNDDLGNFAGPEGHWHVYVRLLRASGNNPTTEDGSSESTLLRKLRLVE
jgi:hypothetical protein